MSRDLAFKHFAARHGFRYSQEDPVSMLPFLRDFRLFKKGGRKRINNVLYAHGDGLNFETIFDYRYTISTGKTTIRFAQTVYFRQHKGLKLPDFLLIPEQWYHRVAAYFGWGDINFVLYPEFSRSYFLKGSDESFISHVFNDKLLSFFTDQKQWSVEGSNYYLVMYQNKRLQNASQLPAFFRNCRNVSQILLTSGKERL